MPSQPITEYQFEKLLRQYDRQLKSVWAYIFNVEKENRKELIQKIYS